MLLQVIGVFFLMLPVTAYAQGVPQSFPGPAPTCPDPRTGLQLAIPAGATCGLTQAYWACSRVPNGDPANAVQGGQCASVLSTWNALASVNAGTSAAAAGHAAQPTPTPVAADIAAIDAYIAPH